MTDNEELRELEFMIKDNKEFTLIYEPGLGNLLLRSYLRKEFLEKALAQAEARGREKAIGIVKSVYDLHYKHKLPVSKADDFYIKILDRLKEKK